MLTVSLHGIKIHAPIGLYSEEHILGNDFEVDIDVYAETIGDEVPFIDYTVISEKVHTAFKEKETLLEDVAKNICTAVKASFPFAIKTKVCIRKLHPPMMGDIQYAQVCLEM